MVCHSTRSRRRWLTAATRPSVRSSAARSCASGPVGGRGAPGHVAVRAHQHGRPAVLRSASTTSTTAGGPPAIRSAAARHAAASRPVSSVSRPSNRSSVERRRPSTRHPGVRRPLPRVRRDHRRRVPHAEVHAQRVGLGRPAHAQRPARPVLPGRAPLDLVAVQQRRRPPIRARPRPASSRGCGPAAIAVFMPTPPTGVIRCAASPTRKPLPARNASASSAAIVNGSRASTCTSRSATPTAVRISSTQRYGVRSAADSPRSGNHCRP